MLRRAILITIVLTGGAGGLLAQNAPAERVRIDSLPIPATAAYFDQLSSAASQTVLTAADIRERGYDQLDELLAAIPGLYLLHDRTTTQVGVCGVLPTEANNQRLLILLDGVPLNDPLSGQAPSGYELRGLPIEDIASVTVQRSPASHRYGNAALLGVIKIVTKRPERGVRAILDGGSFGELDGGLAIGQVWGKTALSLSGRYGTVAGQDLYFPEFRDTLTSVEGIFTGGDAIDFAGTRLRLDHGRWSLKGSYNWRDGTIPTAPASALPLDKRSFFNERRLYADLSYAGPAGENQAVTARLFLNSSRLERELYYESGPEDFENQLQRSLWLGAQYEHLFRFSADHHFLAGTEFWWAPQAEFVSAGDFGRGATSDFPWWNYGLYAHDRWQLSDAFGIEGGFRADFNARTDPVLAPQLALRFQPGASGSTIRLGYSRGYRLPSLLETEIDRNGGSFPNAGLTPEIANSLELAWRQPVNDRLGLNLALYHQALDGPIITDDNFQYQNAPDSILRAAGLEGGLVLRWPQGPTTYLNYNFNFGNGDKVNIPSPICKFGVTVPFWRHFTFYTEGQYEGARLGFDGRYTAPFFLLNGNLRFQLRPTAERPGNRVLRRSSIALRVFNLFDEFYQHPAGPAQGVQRITQNGRTWQTQLTLRF
jgi:iron complex outermembrane receptor protein